MSVSDQCCSNPPTLIPDCGAGEVQELGGLSCYISGSADSKISVILISDIFGYEAPKLRIDRFVLKLADKVAAAGYYTVVPDYFRGDPCDADRFHQVFPGWIKIHGPEQGFEDTKPLIEALKSKGITKIGAAGFCWGAKVVVELAKEGYIQAGVLLHPSLISLEDIQGVKVPLSILGAEHDQSSPPELVRQFETILNAKPEVDAFVKIFPGVSHGWTVRCSDDDDHAVKSAEEAHGDMLDWFAKYLK
ncbi:UNVERIFIED_CONTAM: putative AIM2 family protein [Sesamum angustifolium]|uniref:AIM2 family protein n=1 Tax=Sesamum angustifolium TaxID=2727405 RepID=A0AAW2IQ64_9LAMI